MPKPRTMHPPDIRTLEGRFKALRLCLGWTWKNCATRFGVAWTTWRNYEAGQRRIPAEMVHALCRSAGVSMRWLIEGEGKPPGKLKNVAHVQADGELYRPRSKYPSYRGVPLS